jgi:uncharacterized membrane protein YhaH (DUF805 family)
MNFIDLFCSTQGRVGRGLYWSVFGIWFVTDIVLRALVNIVSTFTADERIIAIPFWVWVAFGIGSYFPMTALLVKRLHDTGRSGYWTLSQHLFMVSVLMMVAAVARGSLSMLVWFLLIGLCLLGMLAVFVFSLMDSDGSNEYGVAS